MYRKVEREYNYKTENRDYETLNNQRAQEKDGDLTSVGEGADIASTSAEKQKLKLVQGE